VDWAISDGDAQWFHFTNILWNAAAVTLLYLLLSIWVPGAPAIVGALIFAVHPVHVEAVANVVGRAEVMAAVFSLGAMLLWTRRSREGAHGGTRILPVLLLYLLAVLSKESAIMLPALLVLCDVCSGLLARHNIREWLRMRVALLAALGLLAIIYVLERSMVTGGLGPTIVDPTLDVATSNTARILTALQAWPIILRLLLFPARLLSDYGPPSLLPALNLTPEAAAGAVILGGAVAGGIAAWWKGYQRTATVLLFIPVAMLPTSNLLIPIGIIVAERTLYLPSIALAMAVAFVWVRVLDRPEILRSATMLLALALVLLLGRTLTRIPVWRNTSTVFNALVRDDPNSFRARWYFARLAANQGDMKLALRRYDEALQIWPYRKRIFMEATGFAAEAGELDFTSRATAFAVQRWPDDIVFVRMRAGVLIDTGDTLAAVKMIERGLRMDPRDTTLLLMQKAVATDTARD
jgi:hypothetical protein